MDIQTILLIVVPFLLAVYVVYLRAKEREMREKYEVERFRREWDLLYLYHQIHPEDIGILEKKDLISDYPVLRKVLERMTIDEIKKYIKDGTSRYIGTKGAPPLPYLYEVDRFIDDILYDGKPPLLRILKTKLFSKITREK